MSTTVTVYRIGQQHLSGISFDGTEMICSGIVFPKIPLEGELLYFQNENGAASFRVYNVEYVIPQDGKEVQFVTLYVVQTEFQSILNKDSEGYAVTR